MSSEDRSRLIRSYARAMSPTSNNELAPSEASIEERADAAIAWADRGRTDHPSAGKRDAVLAALRAMALQTESALPVDDSTYEAIILPALRPVGDILGGTFQLPNAGEFADLVSDDDTRKRLETAIRSVACLTLPGHPSLPYGGTCFVVGKDLVMTNRHVAQIFSSGLGTRGLKLLSRAAADPLREEDGVAGHAFEVAGVRMIHPYWDMALLDVPGLALPSLSLAPASLGDPGDGRRRVAVIGYPAFDGRCPSDVQMTVFRNRFSVKRLSPGYLTGYQDGTVSFSNRVKALTHDSSTLGGNSGSAIVDVATGHVVALHFSGSYLRANYAVPVAELARDGRVIDAGVTFTAAKAETGLLSDPAWSALEAEKPAASTGRAALAPASAAAAGTTVRVTIPIELTITVGQTVTSVAASAVVSAPAGEVVETAHRAE